MNLDALFQGLDPASIHRVLAPHDEARRAFQLAQPTAPAFHDFAPIVTRYIQHHHAIVRDGTPDDARAFGEAKAILDKTFSSALYHNGYECALARGTRGGMDEVIQQLALTLKTHAFDAYVTALYYDNVNPSSRQDNETLARALRQRYGDHLEHGDDAIQRVWQHVPPIFRF